MTTHVEITVHKPTDVVVRVALVNLATGETLSHHDVIAGHCQEACVFTVYEGVGLVVQERVPEPVAPPALPSQENPAVTADAPQPSADGGQPAAEGQLPELAAVAEQTASATQAPVQDAPATAAPSEQPPAPVAPPTAAAQPATAGKQPKAKTGAKSK